MAPPSISNALGMNPMGAPRLGLLASGGPARIAPSNMRGGDGSRLRACLRGAGGIIAKLFWLLLLIGTCLPGGWAINDSPPPGMMYLDMLTPAMLVTSVAGLGLSFLLAGMLLAISGLRRRKLGWRQALHAGAAGALASICSAYLVAAPAQLLVAAPAQLAEWELHVLLVGRWVLALVLLPPLAACLVVTLMLRAARPSPASSIGSHREVQ